MRFTFSLIVSSLMLLSACATTPEQKAARAAAQKRYEQDLQVALAAQCDPQTAALLRQEFDKPEFTSEQERQNFRLRYIEKISDPMFQACYKMAWQNHISQERLRELERYHYWDDFYPWRRPFDSWYW
ncbi:MAG: hypothetical protein Q4B82_01450 [Alysiella sp.]|uniref:hypothetical protein n=1 Tax=Alysiella sp. TaxID=1872483 RepID=UPI0026DBA4A6|nr:hypothetical protein [Alysiella sp.]MDO4433230.1 hypothetical protein [Alysiella sp.]